MLRRLAPHVASLTPAERMALLSDEWALVRAGRHDVGAYLDLASGFSGERTPEVMAALTSSLRSIEESLTTAATRTAYRAWTAMLLSPALADVGWTAVPGEPDARRSLRATVIEALGEVARDEEVLMQARRVVEGELAKPGSTDPTLLNVVVGLATLRGDGALYDRYLARATRAADPADQYLFLHALASFSDPMLVGRTLAHILGPDVRSQDAKIFIADLLTNPSVNALAWQMLKTRWDDVQKKTGEFVGNTVIVSALSAFCDTRSLEDIRAFFASHRVPDAERTLQQALERIAGCIRLAQAQQPRLAEWLAGRPQ
jgi:puromycin-sensitive aminopeptidase